MNVGEQMSIFDLDIWSGKTYPELSPQTEERTLEQSSKRPRKWPKGMPAYLNLTSGHRQDASWEMGGVLLGEYTMHSFGECPNEERESRLSQILEGGAHPKYCLSAKACQGILRRAAKRNKELPEILRLALERQSVSRNEPENLGGGKGILIQNEHTGALSTVNNQSVCYGISPYGSNAMLSSNPHSGIYEANTSRTLDLNGGSPVCNQGGIAVVQRCDMYNGTVTGDKSMSMTSGRADVHHTPSVICIEGNGTRESHRGDGYKESETMFTLNTVEQHAVMTQQAFGEYKAGGAASSLKMRDYKDATDLVVTKIES